MRVYKPSGIKWLGEIPQSWEIKKCKFFFIIQNTIVGDLWNKTKLLSLTLNGVVERDINNPEGKFPSDFSTYQLVKRGNLVFCLFDVEETPRAIGLSQIDGMITSAYTVIKVVNQNERFLAYLFISLDNGKNLSFLYRGLRKTISKEDLLNLKIPLPPLQEQKEIAEFLDKKCEKIQNYINKKQKLITLLQEKKQALINEAVTKGLNPNIESKNSGIEYLGLIPHHWEIKKLKYVGKVVLGKMLCNEHQKGYSHCYYLKSKNLQWLNVEVSQIEKMWFSEYEKSLYRIKKDDLLVSEGGEVGKTCIWNNELAECYIQNSVHKITLNKFNNAKFFLYLFFTYGKLGVFDSVVSRVSIAHLVLEKLVNVDMVVPPLQEQKQIANFLDEKCEKINSAIEKTKRQIELIKEYKNTLINEAVCGRIRVN
ncbi:restriction endonuclease subunit S [Campylobacter upsaliensis]